MPFLQVVDSGLDETSCFFIDDDEEEIEHGHYFEELAIFIVGLLTASSREIFSSYISALGVFEGGDFSYNTSRRKVNEQSLA